MGVQIFLIVGSQLRRPKTHIRPHWIIYPSGDIIRNIYLCSELNAGICPVDNLAGKQLWTKTDPETLLD